MLRLVGMNDKGDLIFTTTSEIGKTEMRLEGIGMIMSWQQAQQLTNSLQTIGEIVRLAIAGYMEVINKAAEALRECMEPLAKEWLRQGKTFSEMLEEVRKIIDSVEDSEERYRVKEEKRVQIAEADTRGRGKPRGKQGKAIKYRPYELRVYGI